MNGGVASLPTPIEQASMLIGEGVEEVLFFEAFLGNLGIAAVQVEQYKGKDGLGPYLKALRNRSGFAGLGRLGIVRDADEDPSAAAASVDGAVAAAAFPAQLTVRKLIVPGGNARGALENLCLLSLAGDPVEACIESYLKCASAAHTSTTDRAKARTHAWLAAQNPPDLRLGHAARKGMLNWASPAFGEVRAFLTSFV
jgi:hypothetical protein